MKAEIGIIQGQPYIRLCPETIGERDTLAYLAAWLPMKREPDESEWYVTGDRLPGSGGVKAQDATG